MVDVLALQKPCSGHRIFPQPQMKWQTRFSPINEEVSPLLRDDPPAMVSLLELRSRGGQEVPGPLFSKSSPCLLRAKKLSIGLKGAVKAMLVRKGRKWTGHHKRKCPEKCRNKLLS